MTITTGTVISHARLLELLCLSALDVGLVEAGDVLLAVGFVLRDVDNVEVCKLVIVEVELVPFWRLLSVEVTSVSVELVIDRPGLSLAFGLSCDVVAALLNVKWVLVEADVAFADVGLLEVLSSLAVAEVGFFVEEAPVVVPEMSVAVVDFSLDALLS
jgi:hypothetical protein